MASLRSIPDDVCIEICSFIHSQGSLPLYTEQEAEKTLRVLATVSRLWCFASRRIGCETTRAYTVRHFTNLVVLLRRRQNYLGTHIRYLTIGSGLGLESHIQLPLWNVDFVDVPFINSLIPGLRHLRIGNIPGPLTCINYNNLTCATSPRIPSTQLTRLTIHSTFFPDASRAKVFFKTMPFLRDLAFLDVTPKFVSLLPAYIPESLKALRLSEYQFWELDEGIPSKSYPAMRMPPNLTLETFHYKNLSAMSARLIYRTLFQLSIRADVLIAVAPSPWLVARVNPAMPDQIDYSSPLKTSFSFEALERYLGQIARTIAVLGIQPNGSEV